MIGATQLPVLCSEASDVARFWRWIRRYALDDLAVATPERPPPLWAQHLYDLDSYQVDQLARALERSCGLAMSYAGVSLRTLAGGEWPPDLIPPPHPAAFTIDPRWGEPDALLELIAIQREWVQGLDGSQSNP